MIMIEKKSGNEKEGHFPPLIERNRGFIPEKEDGYYWRRHAEKKDSELIPRVKTARSDQKKK